MLFMMGELKPIKGIHTEQMLQSIFGFEEYQVSNLNTRQILPELSRFFSSMQLSIYELIKTVF